VQLEQVALQYVVCMNVFKLKHMKVKLIWRDDSECCNSIISL